MKAKQPRNRRIRWLNHDEARNLVEALPEHLKPVVIFALATGLRRGNILSLEWSQLDITRKMAWIHLEDAKGGRAIGVALNDTACQVLRSQMGKHHRWVFCSHRIIHKIERGENKRNKVNEGRWK